MSSNCRFCATELKQSFCDLGMSPLSNSYIKPQDLDKMEPFYPLHVYVCENCLLVQLEEFETPSQIFEDYLYFSSFSDLWLAHAKAYTEMIIPKLNLDQNSYVVEVASNDGYLLKNFIPHNIPALGIEPAKNVAEHAREKGVDTVSEFFGEQFAKKVANEKQKADLIIANNVLAHVPDLNDFVLGFKQLLAEKGTVTVEFPHLLELVRHRQFDTIYHEHFSYFSIISLRQILEHHGLHIYDIEQLQTHGGSLRVYICHQSNSDVVTSTTVEDIIAAERAAGLDDIKNYLSFHHEVEQVKYQLLEFLISQKQQGKKVVAYGAPAKGNTLLNYCGIKSDLLAFTVDRSPHKQGHYLPGTHLPVYPVEKIREEKPDFVLILPWNISEEIIQQLDYIKEWGGQFAVPIPKPGPVQ